MKLKHLINTTLAGLLACALWSCDTVKEDDRLIPVKKPDVNRNVLIEDFTGQNCIKCPAAAEEIEKLQERYGDAIIAVAIHSGPFGHRTTMSSPRLPLCTETGDEYYTHWDIKEQPTALINRRASLSSPDLYADAVAKEVEKTTPLEMTLTAGYDAATRHVDIAINATTSEAVSGKLQVWVIENNIVAQQKMGDGSTNSDYIHQHVFRTSVTSDIYGDEFSVTEAAPTAASYQVTLDETWKAEDVVIVAIASNAADGVLQVVKAELTINE